MKDRLVKNKKKAFREYNIRQKGLGRNEMSFTEWENLKSPLSSKGVICPKIIDGEKTQVELFGQSILTTTKVCIKCDRRKPEIDFLYRKKNLRVENICKECEKLRKRKLYASSKK